jgi:hypothetical protein
LGIKKKQRRNNQTPSTCLRRSACPPHEASAGGASRRQAKYQIISKSQLPKFCFGYLEIGHWNLFGAWDLVIGIFWIPVKL